METTETYLNLNSEQFSSWLNEFDSKYKKAENTLLTSEEKLSEKNNESESEEVDNSESEESEVEVKEEESDIFIKKNVTETPDFNTENSSSVNRFLRRKIIRKPEPISSENKETTIKKEAPQKSIEKKEFIYQMPKEKIFSLAEINKILPKKEYVKEEKYKEQVDNPKEENTKKLSGVALYKLISRRR